MAQLSWINPYILDGKLKMKTRDVALAANWNKSKLKLTYWNKKIIKKENK